MSTLFLAACSSGPKEIPTEDMARIMMQMLVDDKMIVNQNPREIHPDSVAPYVERLGFTPADYAMTAQILDRDSLRAAGLQRAMIHIIDHDNELGFQFKKKVLVQDLLLQGMDSTTVERLARELDSNARRYH